MNLHWDMDKEYLIHRKQIHIPIQFSKQAYNYMECNVIGLLYHNKDAVAFTTLLTA